MTRPLVRATDFRTRLLGVEVGPFRREFTPGWRPPDLGREDECMRASFSCAAGVHPLKIPWIAPGKGHTDHFWANYKKLALFLGLKWDERVTIFDREGIKRAPWPFADDELWIAGVGGVGDGGGRGITPHAIVMRGQKLHYDPMWDLGKEYGRKRRPTRVGWGIALPPAC